MPVDMDGSTRFGNSYSTVQFSVALSAMSEDDERSITAGQVADAAGLSYRQLNDWAARGAMPDNRDGKSGWRRFSPKEVFALMVAKELRVQFGVSVERLSYVTDVMLREDANHLLVATELMAILGAGVWLLTDFESTFIMDSELEFEDLLQLGFFGGDDAASYAFLKLNPLVKKLWRVLDKELNLDADRERTNAIRSARMAYFLPSDSEQRLLDHISSGKYERIEIQTSEGQLETLKLTSHRQVESRLEEIIQDAAYQTIKIVQRDGDTVLIEQTLIEKPRRDKESKK